jgi:hypothetical protein
MLRADRMFASSAIRGVLCLAVVMSAASCSGASAPSTVPFQITSPATGTTVTSSQVTVSGTAPSGSTVTEEVLFAEVGATADAAGKWLMIVKLDEGLNDLTFQLNDDQNARIHLQVTFAPAPTPTPAPPTATPYVISGFGATDADWNATHNPDPSGAAGALYDYDLFLGADRYYAVDHQGGRVVGYSMNISSTKLSDAEAQAKAELPPDAVVLWRAERPTCEQVEYQSAILGEALAALGDPQGQVIVWFATLDETTMAAKLDVNAINEIVLAIGVYPKAVVAPPC